MFLKILFVICSLALFCGCSVDNRGETDRISDEILSTLASKMKKESLDCTGTGGGELHGKINLIKVGFTSSEVLNIEKSRELIVKSADTLLSIINTNKKYEPYFDPFPASYEILHIDIWGKESSEREPDYVELTSLIKGMVIYDIDTKRPTPPLFITVHTETFEEAEKIVSCSDKNL